MGASRLRRARSTTGGSGGTSSLLYTEYLPLDGIPVQISNIYQSLSEETLLPAEYEAKTEIVQVFFGV